MAKSRRAGSVLPRDEAPRQDSQAVDQGITALSYLISGVLVWGLLGLLGDHLLGTRFLVPIGIVLGAGLGCYMIIARFGGLGSVASGRSSTDRTDVKRNADVGAKSGVERTVKRTVKGEESTWAP